MKPVVCGRIRVFDLHYFFMKMKFKQTLDVAVFVEEVLLFFFFFFFFDVVVFVVRVRVVVVALRNVLSLFVFEVWFLRCEKIGIGQFLLL